MNRLPNKWAMKGPLHQEVVEYINGSHDVITGQLSDHYYYTTNGDIRGTIAATKILPKDHELITLEQFREMTKERVYKEGTQFFHKDDSGFIYSITKVIGNNVTVSWNKSRPASVAYPAEMSDKYFSDGTWVIKQTEQMNMKKLFTVEGSKFLKEAFIKELESNNIFGFSDRTRIRILDEESINFISVSAKSDVKPTYLQSRTKEDIHYILPQDYDKALKAFKEYYEEEYKIGDYIYYNYPDANISGGKVHRIINILSDRVTTDRSEYLGNLSDMVLGGYYAKTVRRATAEEIKEAQKPKSRKVSICHYGANFSVEVFKDKVVFEDATISLESLKSLVDINRNQMNVGKWAPKFTKVDIGCKKDVLISDLANLLEVANQL